MEDPPESTQSSEYLREPETGRDRAEDWWSARLCA
jgi:hypothetical protein